VFPGLELTVSDLESRAINEDKTPKVILSASGMCDAGRVRHHLKHNLWRPESMVLFVGYQTVGTLGRILVDGARSVKLFGEEIEVRAQIDVLPGVSGHADKEGLLRWLAGFREKPKLIFVNHGDPESADSFTKCLNEEKGYHAFAPYSGTEFDPLSGQFICITEGRPVEKKSADGRKLSPAFQRLIAAAERLLAAAKKLEGHANKVLAGHADRLEKLAERMERDI
jgi:metallo-beta-lactamase family protein